MTTNSTELAPVTMARIVETMRGFDITLDVQDGEEIATANLNDLPVVFAVLGSAAIVRADTVTDQTLDGGDPTLYLAANQVNCASFGAQACVVDRAEKLIIRTEREMTIAAGMSDIQLSTTLRDVVDSVLATQDGVKAAADNLAELRATVEKSSEDKS